jgi:hypothetical protein
MIMSKAILFIDYPIAGLGNLDICPTTNILSRFGLTLDDLKSRSKKTTNIKFEKEVHEITAFKIYKKDKALQFSDEFLSCVLDYYQLLTEKRYFYLQDTRENYDFYQQPLMKYCL